MIGYVSNEWSISEVALDQYQIKLLERVLSDGERLVLTMKFSY